MRSREEIEKKIAELYEHARVVNRKIYMCALVFIPVLAAGVTLISIGLACKSPDICVIGFLIMVTNTTTFLFFFYNREKEWITDKERDPLMAKTLAGIIDLVQTPGGKNEMLKSIREMIIARSRRKTDLISLPFSSKEAKERHEEAARYKALTWLIPPEHVETAISYEERTLRLPDKIRTRIETITANIKYIEQVERKVVTPFRVIFLCIVFAPVILVPILGDEGVMASCFVFPLYFINLVIFILSYGKNHGNKKWAKKKRKRTEIAAALEEAFYLTATPQGREDIFMLLDEMLIEKGKSGRVNMARLEAYTWVASPGGLPGGKQEG
jgi:hypothetical protein